MDASRQRSLSGCLPTVSQWPRALAFLRLPRGQIGEREARHLMRPKAHQEDAIQMLVDSHLAACQSVPPAGLVYLHDPVVQGDGVVLVHRALVLDREYPFQVFAARADESAALSRRRHRKAAIELLLVFLAQEAVSFLHRPNVPNAQLLR